MKPPLRGVLPFIAGLSLFQFSSAAAPDQEPAILQDIQRLNAAPPAELNDKVDPAFSILRDLYDKDGPDFLTLRKLLGQADVRGSLNPSAKGILAGVISQRWDTFALSGNLYLASLRSPNAEIRN